MASACNYNPDVLDVRSKPKLAYVIAPATGDEPAGRSYAGRIDGVPFKLHADICTTLTAEATVTVPKDKQAQSVVLMSRLLDRLGIVLGGVRLTPAEQRTLKASGELAINRGVTHRVYHYKVEPGGGVVISAYFSG